MFDRLKFLYITDSGLETLHKDKATVTIDDDMGIGFLVKASYEDLLLSGKQYKLDTSKHSTDTEIFAYLHDNDAPDRANPTCVQKSCEIESIHCTSSSSRSKSPCADTERNTVSLNHAPEVTNRPRKKGTKKPEAVKNIEESAPKLVITSVLESENSQSSISSVRSISSGIESQKSIPSLTSDSQDTSSQPLPIPDFTLTSGTFEVVLIMDNREVFGAGASKDTMVTELKKNKVPLEVRPLSIGDFVWIARTKTGIFHTVNKAEELVLDYIIERKRMDDLASSIVDGRFKEQKFRLKNCGLRRPIYLVEDYGSVQHFSINQDALNQAVVNTQIIDNFYIKRTRDVKESVAYLTIMTRYLQGLYSHKTLHACSKKDLEQQASSSSIQDLESRLITYQEFDKMSVKSRKLTVQETFGKQLVQINGITVDKAAAIVEKYKTPQSLIETYKNCSTEKEKQTLLTAIKFGPLNRAIGAQISKMIYWLYSRETLC